MGDYNLGGIMKKLFFIFFILLLMFGCQDGENGSDGTNGSFGTLTKISDESAGKNCTTGGKRFDVGLDNGDGDGTANDGVLQDSEIDSTDYVCNGDDGNDSVATVTNPSGKAEAGPCYLLSDVSAMSMDTSWVQSGYVLGEMHSNDGTFGVPGSFSGDYIVYDFDGTCYSEGDNTDVSGVRMKMGQGSSATSHNVNHATTWRYHLAKRYFNNSGHANYNDIPGAFVQAKTDIYNFLNFTNATANFYELSITGTTAADAYLLAFEAAVTKGRNGPEQNNYIGQAVNAVIENDLTFRNNLRDTITSLPIHSIYTNLKNKLTSSGFTSTNPAPIYNLPIYPAYYADLSSRTPTVLESFSLSATSTCTFDTTGYDSFAYPIVFTSIEDALHFASELTGTLSIWSVTTCNQGSDYPCPLAEVVSIQELNEILLEPAMNYNGYLGAHGLTNGNQYFIVQNFDNTTTQPQHICNGDINQFGRALATVDNNWSAAIGWNNVTNWFNRMPMIFITN